MQRLEQVRSPHPRDWAQSLRDIAGDNTPQIKVSITLTTHLFVTCFTTKDHRDMPFMGFSCLSLAHALLALRHECAFSRGICTHFKHHALSWAVAPDCKHH